LTSDERYIVKTSSRIQGPFSLEELAARVARRELNMLDEVRTPEHRWCFVREVPSFKDIIDRLRSEEMHSGEHTQTSVTLTSRTYTSNSTHAGQEPTNSGLKNSDPGMVSIQAKEKVLSSQAAGTSGYGSISDRRVQQRVQASQLKRNVFLGLAFVLGLAAVYFYATPKSRGPNKTQILEFARYAEELARMGKYSEALSLLQKDERNAYLNPEQLLLKAKLYVQITPQLIEAKRILDILQGTKEDAVKPQISLVRSLIMMKERKWVEADQGLRVLLGGRLFEGEAKVNLAVLRYLTGNAPATYQSLSQIPANSPFSNYAKYLKGLTVLMDRTGSIAMRPEIVAEELIREADVSRENRFEMTMVGAALYLKAGRKNEVERTVDSLLNMNPFSSSQFLTSLNINYSPLSWEYLGDVCETVSQAISVPQKVLALNSLCRFLQGQEGGALTQLEQARRQYSSDLMLAAIHALLLKQANRDAEAQLLIKFLDGKSLLLGELVLAEACIAQSEWACVERSLQTVRSLDSREPIMFYGLGLLAKQRGQNEVVRDMITQGLRNYPRYRPLIELRGDSHGY